MAAPGIAGGWLRKANRHPGLENRVMSVPPAALCEAVAPSRFRWCPRSTLAGLKSESQRTLQALRGRLRPTGSSPTRLPGGRGWHGKPRSADCLADIACTGHPHGLHATDSKVVGFVDQGRPSVSPILRAAHDTPPDLEGQTPFTGGTGQRVGPGALRTEVAEERMLGAALCQ